MEKGTPHVRLHKVKAMVEAGKVRATFVATQGAIALGLPSPELVAMSEVVLGLTTQDFYKSMTAYENHTIWHDVYKPVINGQEVYIKLIVIDDVLIVSFKESGK